MKNAVTTAIMVILLGLASPTDAATDQQWATIGTGSLTGVYHSAGHAIQKTVARHRGKEKVTIAVEETQGSLENLEAITSGRFYFGIVQSDLQYKAWHGTNRSPWGGRPQTNLRAVASLYTEAINLVAATRSNVQSVSDLKGRRIVVNLGEPGSGQYVNAHEILDIVGIDPEFDFRQVQLSPVRALDLFRRRQLDAFFFTAGHPAAQFHEVASGDRRVQFVTMNPKDELLAKYPYYQRTSVPIKYYRTIDNDQDVKTIGVKATLVASADTPDWMAYRIVKALIENMDFFKTQLLVLQDLNREGMVEALHAPIHPGALKYYREIGLMP
ncbi:MAG: TAXI family TRAP transporter solute-binding subunit [Desulfobacterales bacterium]|nr:TAXI family TRAP transporter solute-binding subunit [Desulfobacterales bacterium]